MSRALSPFRFSLRRLLAAVVLIAAIGTLYVATIGRPPISRLFGGGRNVATIREATRVEAYRLEAPSGREVSADDVSPLEYEVTSVPAVVPAKRAKKLAQALLSPQTYEWETAKACVPIYGVKISFFKGVERVDVFFCFACDILTVTSGDFVFGVEDFDHSRLLFVRTVKELFPDAPVIQGISE